MKTPRNFSHPVYEVPIEWPDGTTEIPPGYILLTVLWDKGVPIKAIARPTEPPSSVPPILGDSMTQDPDTSELDRKISEPRRDLKLMISPGRLQALKNQLWEREVRLLPPLGLAWKLGDQLTDSEYSEGWRNMVQEENPFLLSDAEFIPRDSRSSEVCGRVGTGDIPWKHAQTQFGHLDNPHDFIFRTKVPFQSALYNGSVSVRTWWAYVREYGYEVGLVKLNKTLR